ncbi:MAG: hypothetical protein VX778_07305 [Candidatus Thermoplasmatota archaeon]|nr:hypothetical protein [Candidatus Thermoplasmatota archaeon]
MNKQLETLLDLLSWTPLARFIRTYRIQQLRQRTLELRMTKNIDLVFDGILKRHSDLLS